MGERVRDSCHLRIGRIGRIGRNKGARYRNRPGNDLAPLHSGFPRYEFLIFSLSFSPDALLGLRYIKLKSYRTSLTSVHHPYTEHISARTRTCTPSVHKTLVCASLPPTAPDPTLVGTEMTYAKILTFPDPSVRSPDIAQGGNCQRTKNRRLVPHHPQEPRPLAAALVQRLFADLRMWRSLLAISSGMDRLINL